MWTVNFRLVFELRAQSMDHRMTLIDRKAVARFAATASFSEGWYGVELQKRSKHNQLLPLVLTSIFQARCYET